MKKKFILFFILLGMISLMACSNKQDNPVDEKDNKDQQQEIIEEPEENKNNDDIEKELNQYIEEYEILFPAVISTNFIFPSYNFPSDINSSVRVTTDLKKVNKTYQYNYPEVRSTFIVDITLEKEDVKISKKIEIPVLSIEEKNSVPKIYLEVSDEITKDEYIIGSFTLQTKDESGEWIDTLLAPEVKIKGRGNSTWGFDKKPYKIKFPDRVSLFGEPKAKTWTLIANYIDHSLMRNYAAYYLGRSLDGLEHTTCAYFVDVYLNGEYKGNYLLCEQTEVDKNRLNIKADVDDLGFLIEMDQKYFESNDGTEGIDYFYSKLHGDNFLFAVKNPDPEDIDYDRVTQIKNDLDAAIAALKANTDEMYDYFDLDSVVDSFIINELTKNKDMGYSSFYLYKDTDGKICFGPIWDYDLSSLAQGNITKEERSAVGWFNETVYKNPFYDYFLRNSKFKKAVKNRWEEIRFNQVEDLLVELENAKDYIYYSALENFKVWDVIGKETGWWISDEEHNVTTWQGQVDLLINYYRNRIDWMTSELEMW